MLVIDLCDILVIDSTSAPDEDPCPVPIGVALPVVWVAEVGIVT
jgi:hypothetical protein